MGLETGFHFDGTENPGDFPEAPPPPPHFLIRKDPTLGEISILDVSGGFLKLL